MWRLQEACAGSGPVSIFDSHFRERRAREDDYTVYTQHKATLSRHAQTCVHFVDDTVTDGYPLFSSTTQPSPRLPSSKRAHTRSIHTHARTMHTHTHALFTQYANHRCNTLGPSHGAPKPAKSLKLRARTGASALVTGAHIVLYEHAHAGVQWCMRLASIRSRSRTFRMFALPPTRPRSSTCHPRGCRRRPGCRQRCRPQSGGWC